MNIILDFLNGLFIAGAEATTIVPISEAVSATNPLPSYIVHVLELFKHIIDIIAVIWMVWGVLLSVLKLVKLEFQTKLLDIEQMVYKENIRAFLATYILLGLELFIVADIIQIIINPQQSELNTLVIVVIVRTVISFFLQKDFHEALENAKALKEGDFDNFKIPHIFTHHVTKATSKKKSDSL